MGESSDKTWSTGEGNGKPLQCSCLENPMNSMKRQNDRILKEELPRSVGTQYATGDQWRNNSRKNEETESKQKQHPVVDVTDDGSKVRCCKEQYCIGTWNVKRERASSCDDGGATWFSRVTAGFSSYDGEFRMPLVLAQASPIFHSSCEGKLAIALE